MSQSTDDDGDLVLLAETENYGVMAGRDIDGEMIYSINLGAVTLHLFQEEWEELIALIQAAARG